MSPGGGWCWVSVAMSMINVTARRSEGPAAFEHEDGYVFAWECVGVAVGGHEWTWGVAIGAGSDLYLFGGEFGGLFAAPSRLRNLCC